MIETPPVCLFCERFITFDEPEWGFGDDQGDCSPLHLACMEKLLAMREEAKARRRD